MLYPVGLCRFFLRRILLLSFSSQLVWLLLLLLVSVPLRFHFFPLRFPLPELPLSRFLRVQLRFVQKRVFPFYLRLSWFRFLLGFYFSCSPVPSSFRVCSHSAAGSHYHPCWNGAFLLPRFCQPTFLGWRFDSCHVHTLLMVISRFLDC